MLETLDSEFVKLARAKGVSETKIVWVHVLRNAVLPIMTFMAIWIATAVSGSVVVEVVFDWPGLGAMFVDAIAHARLPDHSNNRRLGCGLGHRRKLARRSAVWHRRSKNSTGKKLSSRVGEQAVG